MSWCPRSSPRPVSRRFFAEMTQLAAGVAIARQTIDLFLSMSHEQASPVPVDDLMRGRVALSIRRHEPVGVVTAITPYNAALIMGFQKLIPALMAGNSVILRPSPLTPISSLIFGAAADAAGLPPGVLERGRGVRHRRRRAAHQPPGRRHGVVHRLDGRGPQDPRPGGTHRQTGVAGTRRQVGADLPAGRGSPRRRRRGRRDRHHGRPGLRGRHPNAGAAGPQRRSARGGERGLQVHQGRSAHRPVDDAWVRSSVPRSATSASGT